MTAATARKRQPATRHLKSSLAAPSGAGLSPRPGTAGSQQRPASRQVLSERQETIEEFADYLRTVTNRDGRPYEEATIDAYIYPVKHLERWMTASGIDGDFTAAGTSMLNRYFREYYQEHGQGGTHTLQRNLLQLFNYLERGTRESEPLRARAQPLCRGKAPARHLVLGIRR